MFRKRSAAQWAVIVALVLLLATTALAAAQSPDLLLPLVTGQGEAVQEAPEAPVEEEVEEAEPPLLEPDPNAPVGDSRDTDSGDYDVELPVEMAAVDAFSASQWTVQNKLGVGTQSPTEDVDISRNANVTTRLVVRNPHTGNSVQTSLFLNTGTSNGLVAQQFGQGYVGSWSGVSLTNMARLRTTPTAKGLIVATGGSYPLILGTSDIERLRITPDGNVGIGTTNPVAKLHVSSLNDAILIKPTAMQAQQTTRIKFADPDGGTGPMSIEYLDDGTPDLAIMGGNVGIGSTVPQAKLHVQGASGGDGVYVAQPGGDGVYVYQPGQTGMSVYQPVGTGVFVNQPGGFGLYVGCPCGGGGGRANGGVLVENGNIVVNGSFVDIDGTLAVPDYVFEPEYPLMSLDELRAYVAKEKHLPNVPNEEEIRAGGLDLSEFQMTLLEKTEELTLYTLAQDEQIKSLQEENQAMQELIADLETRLAALEAQE